MSSNVASVLVPLPEKEERVEALLQQLTQEEKLRLLAGQPGRGATFGVERLGLPELRMSDGPMGVHWWCSAATAYPALLAAAASWDESLWLRLGASLGRDARARGVHVLLAPGVNIHRSPRCGRNFEYAGEDPFLTSRVAVGFIRGVQSKGVACTVKHFAVNFQEYDRHRVSSDLDDRTLHEIYLLAFRAAVTEAGCAAVMTAYNPVNGTHCSEHRALITDILKTAWGFRGLVMSDWVSTYGTEACANAGLDLEMPTAEWFRPDQLQAAVDAGRVDQALIDDKVRRLLRLAVYFGWLDGPQRDPELLLDDPESDQVALDVARRGIVLLKNSRQLLPFQPSRLRRLAVLGPLAHPPVWSGAGSAFTTPFHAVSVLDGLREYSQGAFEVLHRVGPDPNPLRHVFRSCALESDMGPGLRAEYYDNDSWTGPPAVTRLDPHVDFAWGPSPPAPEISVEHFSVRWTGRIVPCRSGVHTLYMRCHDAVVRVSIDGTTLLDTWKSERNGVQTVEVNLEAGRAVGLEILYKKVRYWGTMQFGWVFNAPPDGEVESCVSLARAADAAVVCVGFDDVSEGEGFDREFQLHPDMERLVRQVTAAQPNTVVVLTAGGNLDMRGWLNAAAAVVHTFYPGQQGGRAIAEILLGQVSPSAKLPVTLEEREDQRSSFDSYHDDDGDLRVQLKDGIRCGYRAVDPEGPRPLFPFGFGLSYTTFRLEGFTLSAERLGTGTLTLQLRVRNTGNRAGREVVQVYVRAIQSAMLRPALELKAFRSVELEVGASQTVTFELERQKFAHYDCARQDWCVESGEYQLLVGNSSADIAWRATVFVE